MVRAQMLVYLVRVTGTGAGTGTGTGTGSSPAPTLLPHTHGRRPVALPIVWTHPSRPMGPWRCQSCGYVP